jgi:hypothetical protein
LTYPGVIFWICLLWAGLSRGPALYYVFFLSWSFGTLAVVPSGISIGSLTAPWIVACVLTLRVVREEGVRRFASAFFDPRRFGLLGICTLYAAGTAYFLPRMFAGQVSVVTMRPGEYPGPGPLQPDMANVTQAIYFILTTLTVISVYLICQDEARRRRFLQAFGWGGAMAILTGAADLVADKAGLSGLLEPFRNAQYALNLEQVVVGMHRVVGLMSEASSYAGLCVPFLSLLALTPTKDSPWGRWRAPLWMGLLLMTALSTSSSGYIGLAALAAVIAMSLMVGMLEQRRAAWWGGYGALMALAGAAALLLVKPSLFDPLVRLADAVVLQKTGSESYIERTTWNRVSYEAYLQTHLLGVGIGSARASSWIYSVLSNIGLPGAVLYFVAIAQLVFARVAAPQDRALARAAKLALVPMLVQASVGSTSVGFGLAGATFFGLAGALCWPLAESVARKRLPEYGPHLATAAP